MVVCPLCEHAQAGGTECEVCGRRLPTAPERAAPVATMPDLEPTLAGPASELPSERIPDLEVTAYAPVAAPAAELFPDLVPSAAPPVDVNPTPMADIDRGLEGLPDDAPTPYPTVVVCRYCRTQAQLGERLCARCGMRLPALALVPSPAQGARAPEVPLCSCGTPVRGPRCPSCGARNA